MNNNKGCGCGFIIALGIVILGIGLLFSSCSKDDKNDESSVDWKEIHLQDVNPADAKFKDELQKLASDPIEVKYSEPTKFLNITYKLDNIVKFNWQFERFARESAEMLAVIHDNKYIDGVDFTMQLKATDDRGNKSDVNGLYVTYRKDNMQDINYNDWTKELYGDIDCLKFFTVADDYDVKPIILNELSHEQVDILNTNKK